MHRLCSDEKERSNLVLCQMASVRELLEKNCEVRKIYAQATKVDLENANETLKLTTIRSLIPGPTQIARIIAAGVTKGQGGGEAQNESIHGQQSQIGNVCACWPGDDMVSDFVEVRV